MSLSSLLEVIIDKNGTIAFQASENHTEYIKSWWLMSSPMTPAVILATYLMFVLKIGPNYMKDRKPYNFPTLISLYNIVQIVISTYLVYSCGRMHVINGLISKTCAMDTESSRYSITSSMHYYLLAKVSELLDTVFFVLRKKDRQLSFLHIYHHALMIIVTWTALKYEPTIHLLFLGMVNSFIHVIMYTYYGLSSFPHMEKYLWWKKYITGLQLIQFVLVCIHFAVSADYSDCTPSYIVRAALTLNTLLFLYLFGKFYIKNYNKNKAQSTKYEVNENNKKIKSGNNKNHDNDKKEHDEKVKHNGSLRKLIRSDKSILKIRI